MTAQDTAQQPQPNVPGWAAFTEALRTLPERMLAKLPTPMREDPQIQQEVARLALESLASCALDAIGSDGDAPVFLPSITQILNVGQPNADTIYRSARITAGGSYRLRGVRGSLNQFKITQVIPRNAETGAGRPVLDANKLPVDADGKFDVLVSATRPAAYTGEWWELGPQSTALMARMVGADWQNERAPSLSIERLDRPPGRPRASAAVLEQKLRGLVPFMDSMALLFVDHVQQLRDEGFTNKFKVFDVSMMGGLVGQFYYECAYEIADDEALIIEVKEPEICPYRSLILTNEIYETIDWYNNHSSLNVAQAPVDADGMLRIVIANREPGVLNWLDTAGHGKGAVQGRWTDCNSHPVPEIRKVSLANVARLLPPETRKITTSEREGIVRARRAALQQRPLW